MTEQMEALSEQLTPTELAEFETYTRTKLSPLINQLLQTFFSAGGFQSAGGGPNGSTRLAPKTQPSTPVTSPTPAAAPTLTPKAAPVASALGAGATGAAVPAPTRASPTTPAPGGESVQLVVAKAAVDSMAKELTGIVERIRTSNNDPATLRSINEDYKRVNQKHASGIPKLVEVLDAQQKATFSEYLKSRLMPVSNELVQAFTAAGALPNQ